MQADVKARAVEFLKTGAVDRVLGWKAGTFFYDLTPAVFSLSVSYTHLTLPTT